MRKILTLLLIAVLGCFVVGVSHAAEGKRTVAEAKELPEGTAIAVQGTIKERLTDTHFLLTDATGEIHLVIAENIQKGFELKPGEEQTFTGVTKSSDVGMEIVVDKVE